MCIPTTLLVVWSKWTQLFLKGRFSNVVSLLSPLKRGSGPLIEQSLTSLTLGWVVPVLVEIGSVVPKMEIKIES